MHQNLRGLSLVELLVTIALLGVISTSLIAVFGYIQRGVQHSKARTVAINLVRERMETLRHQRYALLRPTTQADLDAVGHDATYFPAELGLRAGGLVYGRFNRVTKAAIGSSGQALALPPTGPDAGLKKIEVWVEWMEDGRRRTYAMSSLLDDPERTLPTGRITGTVYAAPGGPGRELPGVQLVIEQNAGRQDMTGAAGTYSLSTSSGAFIVRAAKVGFFPAREPVSAMPDGARDFTLVARGSGTITGFAYLRDHLVISRVVTSTATPAFGDAQFVELYNPTTAAISLAGGALRLRYASPSPPTDCPDIALAFVSSAAAPSGFYLIANSAVISVDGSTVAADAFFMDSAAWSCLASAPGWSPPASRRLLQPGQPGSVALYDAAGGRVDAVGWTAGAFSPPVCEGACAASTGGLLAGEQLVRLSTPSLPPGLAAPSYDSHDNAADFALVAAPAVVLGPRTTAFPPAPAPTGTPAVGAVIAADDDLSSPVVVSSPTGHFTLPGVATCTAQGAAASWTIQASSRGLAAFASGVTPSAGGAVSAGELALVAASSSAVVAGLVLSSTGTPLPGILVSCGGATTAADAAGAYRLLVTGGTGLVATANPGRADPGRASAASAPFDLAAGQTIGGVSFALESVGRLTGVATIDGVNPLPGAVVEADAPPGTIRGTATSDSTGRFVIEDLPVSAASGVGTYSVFPALDASQASAPASVAATLFEGAEVDVGTFTVSRALGAITGTVSDSGAPIAAGVLIVATHVTLGAAPPDWDETLRSGATYYYAAHAGSDGSFTLPVRVSATPYNVYAWYSKANGETATVTALKTAAQLVSAPAPFTVSFSWP